MDLRVELAGGVAVPRLPEPPTTIRLEHPILAALEPLVGAVGAVGRSTAYLDATWDPAAGPPGLLAALDRLGREAVAAARSARALAVVSDAALGLDRLPVPSVLAIGAVHTALTATGLRGRMDLVADAADVLDVHALAMAVACGASAVHPRLAIELAAELAGTRGAEPYLRMPPSQGLLAAFDAGLRKTLARMGISTAASIIGAALFDTLELAGGHRSLLPGAAAWPGRVGFDALAARQLRRLAAARALPEPPHGREARLPDPGLARFLGDGEIHLYAPRVVTALQAVASAGPAQRSAALAAHVEQAGSGPRACPR